MLSLTDFTLGAEKEIEDEDNDLGQREITRLPMIPEFQQVERSPPFSRLATLNLSGYISQLPAEITFIFDALRSNTVTTTTSTAMDVESTSSADKPTPR